MKLKFEQPAFVDQAPLVGIQPEKEIKKGKKKRQTDINTHFLVWSL